jgi:uroporphyrinogen-III synthase
MYCPVCRAEYRPGVKECSDCHVALVEQLPEEGAPTAYRVLWKGESAAFAEKLAEELQNAGIEAVSIPLDVLARNRRDFFDVAERPLFGAAVSVTTQDFKAAERIKEKLLEQEPGEDLAGLPESRGKAEGATRIHELPIDWDPATATVELWRGSDPATLSFAEDALHGVGIPTREDSQQSGLRVLFVRPEDADRGREILREVAEGQPPE